MLKSSTQRDSPLQPRLCHGESKARPQPNSTKTAKQGNERHMAVDGPGTAAPAKRSTKTKKELDAKRLIKARRLKANQRARAKEAKSSEPERNRDESPADPSITTINQPASLPKSTPKIKLTADQLAWRSLDESIQQTGGISTLDEGGGMMMFEEVDGVGVEWEEDELGRKKAVLIEQDKESQGRKGKGVEKGDVAGKGKGKKRKRDDTEVVGVKVEQPEDEVEWTGFGQGQEEDDPDALQGSEDGDEADSETELASATTDLPDILIADTSFDPSKLPSWTPESFTPALPEPLHPIILRGLLVQGFETPTEIQKKSIGVALGHLASSTEQAENKPTVHETTATSSSHSSPPPTRRDIIGVSETGSGKTLAYSLPILHHLLSTGRIPHPRTKRQLAALILCPTRELALQVGRHVGELVKAGEAAGQSVQGEKRKGKGKAKPKTHTVEDADVKDSTVNQSSAGGPPRISVATVVGGLSAMKQKRLLARGCDILIATPGRLWELCEEDQSLAIQIKRIRYLVIDEADRMIEAGHFAELENIVQLTERGPGEGPVATNAKEDDPIFAVTTREVDKVRARKDMQTFVFSATLSKDLQANLKRGIRRRRGGNKGSTLDDLVERLDFRDEKPHVINLSREGGVVATLRESLIECIVSEKDFYLYYFLLRYPGRTLVFVGSVDGIRRLVPLFEILKVPVFPLHSQLQQKQRLKNLDRFSSSKSGVLIATDVAARGLDIPSVDHVIHFQLPRTADAYIHRSGRTARAKRDGFSLIMCSPEERGALRALMKGLGRTPDLPELPVEPGFLAPMKNRIRIAKDIEKAQHHTKREKSEKGWLAQAAETLGVDIDDDLISDEEDQEDAPEAKRRRNLTHKYSQGNVQNLRAELDSLLRQQLMARGVSAKYPTSGSRAIMDDLLNTDSQHVELLGASTKKAHEDVDAKPKGKKFQTFGKKRK